MYSYDPQSIRLWLRSERRRYVEDSPLQMPSADALPFYFFCQPARWLDLSFYGFFSCGVILR